MQTTVERLMLLGLSEEELRRAFENELAQAREEEQSEAVPKGRR
jgi:hypothetical protein